MIIYSKYNYLLFESNNYYVYNSLNRSLLKIDKDVYNKLLIFEKEENQVDKNRLKKKDFKLFYENKIFIDSDEERKMINNIKLESFLRRYDKSQLSLTIAPTTFCNFKCIYCYEDTCVPKKMNSKVEDKIIGLIRTLPEVKNLSITWFGGEPLMAIKRIESITKKILTLNLNYNAIMITNGYLLNENIIKKLKELKIYYLQVTIDGLEETHNKRRILKGQGNSFKRIIENLSLLMQIAPDIKVNIRINIDKSNENELPPLYALLKEKFNNNYSITPAFVVSESINYSHCLTSRYEKSIFQLSNKFLPILNFYPLHRTFECMARDINSYLIDPEGNMYKCYEDIGKKKKRIGNLNSKGINTSILTDYLVGEDPFSDVDCLNCKLLPICNGGCPYLRLNKKENKDYCITMKGFEKDFIMAHLFQKERRHNKALIK